MATDWYEYFERLETVLGIEAVKRAARAAIQRYPNEMFQIYEGLHLPWDSWDALDTGYTPDRGLRIVATEATDAELDLHKTVINEMKRVDSTTVSGYFSAYDDVQLIVRQAGYVLERGYEEYM